MRSCVPNLPQNSVKKAFVSEIMPDEIKENLYNFGIETVTAPVCSALTSELKYHPDIVLNNPAQSIWYCIGDTNMNNLLTKGEATLADKYPKDCAYNCFIIDGVLYGGKNVAQEIKKYSERHIVIAQGYTKCSTVILSAESFITSDISVYKALVKEGKNVLKVSNGGILLNGYSCGFIGGCTGVLGNKILSVTGNAKLLEDYDLIQGFCKNIGYDVVSLSKAQPYDYGGILPICEDD